MTRAKGTSIRVGVSACLLGHSVRYDGGHKRHAYVSEVLAGEFDLVAVCPEMELGLGVPRETIQLVGDGGPVRLITSVTQRDITREMDAFAAQRLGQQDLASVAGFVLKARSPSCGVAQVKQFEAVGSDAPFRHEGRGRFAAAAMQRTPGVPVIEEAGLDDPEARRAFIRRVRAFAAARSG